jgi:cytochrome c553
MKKSLITLTVMLAAAALVAVFCGSAMAKVTGSCAGCHTMHNSQDGKHMILNTDIDGTGGPDGGGYTSLTRGTCVGCHTGDVNVGIDKNIPFVNSASEPSTYLAGGNFYWVAQTTNGDAKGHNVKGIPGMTKDAVLTTAPGNPVDNPVGCDTDSCHQTLFEPAESWNLDTGCQGCHLAPKHHATQQADGAPALEANGFFRFLSGHYTLTGDGVEGIEDDDWQFTNSATDHNEYLGKVGTHTGAGGFRGIGGNTMTAYCTGCHGNFHIQQDGSTASANWIRHPSDAVLPDTGEYSVYTSYDPDVPVARPILGTGSSATVEPGTDLVMCLSCHRAHGSPNDDLLRWNYDEMVAGNAGDAADTGCFKCHSEKD